LSAIRKSEFARLCNVSAPCVSQWISSGKIDGKGIVGEGRSALIDPAVALKQLKERLVGGLGGLMHALGSDIAALGSMVAAYDPLSEILERMSGPPPETPHAAPADEHGDAEVEAPRAPPPRKSPRRSSAKSTARKRVIRMGFKAKITVHRSPGPESDDGMRSFLPGEFRSAYEAREAATKYIAASQYRLGEASWDLYDPEGNQVVR
jgi:hypothetical protein